MKKMILLMCIVSMAAMSGAAIIYQETFPPAETGTDLNGTTPDVTTNGAVWAAGADFDADGKVVFTNADGSLGDGAYLPFVPQDGFIYTFTAKVDTRPSPLRDNNPNDWIAIGFAPTNTPVARRFYDDPGGADLPGGVYWMMTRTNMAASPNFDQDFIGYRTNGGQTFAGPALSCDNLKIILNTLVSTWTVSWYFNNTLDRTVNVGAGFTLDPLRPGFGVKDYFKYIMISNNRSDGFIDDVLLTGIPVKAWNPTPANNATGISNSSVTFQWNKGHDPNDDLPDPNVASYTLRYIAYPAESVPAEPNVLGSGSVAVTGISAAGNTGSYGSIAPGYDKAVFWRVDEVLYAGGPIVGVVWRFDTIKSVPIVVTQPVNTVIMRGGSGSLTIGATSISPDLVYTWKQSTDTVIDDGDTPVGTDANTLTINLAAASDEGYYYCKLTNAGGANTTYSNVVTLGVKREIAHWTLDSDANSWDGTYYLDETPLTIDPVVQNADPNGTPDFDDGVNPTVTSQGVTIDTINGYASAGTWNPSQFTNQFTVSLWAKWAGQTTPTTWQGLISKETSYGTGNMMWQLEVSQAAQASSTVVLKNGLGTGDLSTPVLPVNNWEHIAVTFNGTTATVYRNGIQAASGTWTMGTKTDAPVNIGISARSLTQNLMFNGMLDDIKIYNYAISNTDVADLWYAVKGIPVCIEPYASGFDVTGPVDGVKDCVVDIKDFAKFAAKWIDCGLYPTWRCP